MSRNITESPEKWVILKLPGGYKVFGSWAGGYLSGDRWKLNSGISKVEEDEDYFYFYGYSGSCYQCYKKSYGTIGFHNKLTLQRIIEKGEGKIELQNENNDWFKLIQQNNE